MNRSDLIRDRLVGHCRDLNLLCSEISENDWRAMPLALQYRFGWMPPVDLDAIEVADNLIVIISPDLLDRITAHLDDLDLGTYLTVIELMIDLFVAHRGQPAEQVAEIVDNAMWDQCSEAFKLRLEVEAFAMDRGIVPVH